MGGGQPQDRRERKYPLSLPQLRQFRWWHRRHGRAFTRAFPSRTVNNIYFEPPDWASYGDNMSGVSRRTKCRLRWYGDADTAEEVTFEVKLRRNAVGHKRQVRISMATLPLPSLPTTQLYARLRTQLPPELRVQLDQSHHAVLYNRFCREYYEAPGGLRMTVDTDMEYAPLPGRPLRTLRPIRSGAAAVVEFKYPLSRQAETTQALRRFPFRATRFSKYVVGVDHLLPH